MLRAMSREEFKRLFHDHIVRDFPPGEYPPYTVMRGYIKKGLNEALLYEDERGEGAGYAVTAAAHANGYVLVSLLAIFEERRGGGYGSRLLAELADRYSRKRGLLIEVERPCDARDEAERALRERRIAFYGRAGFKPLPRIDFVIFGIPMLVMARPITEGIESDENYIRTFREIYGEMLGPFLYNLKAKIR